MRRLFPISIVGFFIALMFMLHLQPAKAATLDATTQCVGSDLQISITAGDANFNITGTGVGLPINNVGIGTYTVTNSTWTVVTVVELGGDAESIVFGTINCYESLIIGLPICFGDDMRFMIHGDEPFTVTGTGPGLPLIGAGEGVQLVAGPGVWTNMVISEQGGDLESFSLGDFQCIETLIHSFPICLGDTLRFTIDQGDAPYNVTGTGIGLPLLGISEGIYNLFGPETWTNVTITETTGDMQSYSLGDFPCLTPTTPIVASAVCVGNNLQVTITNGDSLFSIAGTGAGLPIDDVGAGIYTLTGPATWSNITIYEGSGNYERPNLGNFTCPLPNIPLNASAVCVGDDLQISITAGDANFNITGVGAGLPMTNIGLGTYTLTGAGTWTGVTITELSGDGESGFFGDIDCPVPPLPLVLNASAVCVGDDLQISITAGDANFNITGAGAGLPMTNIGLGTYTLTGAGTWTGVTVTELSGDGESAILNDFTCSTTVIPPPVAPPIVALSPDLTALGCVFTVDVDIFNVPTNTYCRILMKDGAVVNYSGAVPADLIRLGVILAVDIYRLEGGASVNTFPDDARVCLEGEGRLFYMDGRNAPRFSVELASESVDGLTCGWIPAPGTLILTN
jgi:hypothetical protein